MHSSSSVKHRVKAIEAMRRSPWNRFSTSSPSRMNQNGRSSTRVQPGDQAVRSLRTRLSSRPNSSNCGQLLLTTS
ncbi:hypothetical protein D3C72_2223260 [compost metagenome]